MAKKLLVDPPKVELSDHDRITILGCILEYMNTLFKYSHVLLLISEWREIVLNDIQQLSIIKFMGNQPYVHDEIVISEVTKFITIKNAIISAVISEIDRIDSGKLSAEEFVKSYTKLMKLLELYNNHVNHNNHE